MVPIKRASGVASIPDREIINLPFVLLLSATGALGGLIFGFDIAIITGAGPFLEKAFDLSHLELGFAFSSLLFGCVVGAGIAGFAANRFGRKPVMLAVAVLFAVTTVATGAAVDFTSFNAARFAGGIAVGAISLVAPLYIAEAAPASLRGRMGALFQLAIVTGILVSYLINYLLRDHGADSWRYMFYTGVVPAVAFLLCLLIVPESPRYMAMRARWQGAEETLRRTIGEQAAALEIEQIRRSLQGRRASMRDFREVTVRRPLLMTFFLAILVHLEGQNTIVDYAPRIFQSAGFSLDAALLSTFVVGISLFVFTIVSFWLIDRVGRRPLYIAGSFGMAASLAVLVASVLLGRFTGWFALVPIVLYLMFFAACIGPVFWTVLPEVFPNHLRSQALIVPVLTQWVVNALVVLFFPIVFHNLGQALTFGLLALFCTAQGLYAWRYLPETKNRTLEEIAAHWRT